MAYAGGAPEPARPPQPQVVAAATPPEPSPEPSPTPEPVLPPGVTPGVFTSVDVAGDASVDVLHGSASSQRAIVYLHGACGDPRAPVAWSGVAVEVGTLIALRGDRACGKNERYYWGPDAGQLEARVARAVAKVAEVRGAAFEPADVVLMGYSQGATRAQALHALHPERYPRVILAGIPVPPSARHLAKAKAVAVLGGQLEHTRPMRAGVWALRAHGIPVRFDLFPNAGHGEFGPDSERVMRETFAWLLQAS